ncbi:MAG: hypothetical protein ACREJD_10360 [Phycisphaerales bacterium]
MPIDILTVIHVVISVFAIGMGFVVASDFLDGRVARGHNALFLLATFATSATGFLFPFRGATPAFVFGVISIAVIAVAGFAICAKGLSGKWKVVYVLFAIIAFYLNAFVLVAQGFQKFPSFAALAPTQQSPWFLGAETLLLIVFLATGAGAVRRMRRA